jgi:hypothetical protein
VSGAGGLLLLVADSVNDRVLRIDARAGVHPARAYPVMGRAHVICQADQVDGSLATYAPPVPADGVLALHGRSLLEGCRVLRGPVRRPAAALRAAMRGPYVSGVRLHQPRVLTLLDNVTGALLLVDGCSRILHCTPVPGAVERYERRWEADRATARARAEAATKRMAAGAMANDRKSDAAAAASHDDGDDEDDDPVREAKREAAADAAVAAVAAAPFDLSWFAPDTRSISPVTSLTRSTRRVHAVAQQQQQRRQRRCAVERAAPSRACHCAGRAPVGTADRFGAIRLDSQRSVYHAHD